MLKQRLERIIKNEKEGSPLHTWAKDKLANLKLSSSERLNIAQMDVQARAMTWQKREQNA